VDDKVWSQGVGLVRDRLLHLEVTVFDEAGEFDNPSEAEFTPLPGHVWGAKGLEELLGLLMEVGIRVGEVRELSGHRPVRNLSLGFQTAQVGLHIGENVGESLGMGRRPREPAPGEKGEHNEQQ
jgi:hypothetical protein